MHLSAIRVNIAQLRQAPLRKTLGVLLRLLIGLLFLVLSFWQVDIQAVWAVFTHLHPGWLLLALLSVVVSTTFKAIRWNWLCGQFGVPSRWNHVLGAYLLGQAANIVLPVRAGEIVRVGWITTGDPTAAGGAVAATLIEKYLDLAALAVFVLVLGGDFLMIEGQWKITAALLLTAGLIGAAVVGPYLWNKVHPLLETRLKGRALKLLSLADGFVQRCEWLRSPRRALVALSITAISWGVMVVTNLLCLQALGMPPDLTAGMMVLTLIYIGVAPALMPGNVGPFYFFAKMGLTSLHPAPSEQLRAAFAMLLHAIITLTPLLFAGIYLLVQQVSFEQLRRIGKTQKASS